MRRKISLLKLIRKYCLDCSGSIYELRRCDGLLFDTKGARRCPLHRFRFGIFDKPITNTYLRRMMKANCLFCSHNSRKEMILCKNKNCIIYKYFRKKIN